ncbi:anthranilate synthase component I [Alkalihalophilus pseudofirmus]|uniref:Anthranilate synthase component 1 n=1 Tax=Alkalihalophilus pseudofirmus TaxID=79885 RepID=A0AAJ2KV03_ALKPS|nr:anthranilate synthase component I [Alkalihalophilus pseudofirmus]MDV2884333.1 anthranilate synthase component I [Alkalihalophilus pseudofirmus]
MTHTDFTSFKQAAKTYDTVPVVKRYFADGLTPIQIAYQLQDQLTFLLESKDAASPWSRYSFIGLNPMYQLVEESGVFHTYSEDGSQIARSQTFEDAFDQTLQHLNVKPLDLPIPFKGGAVGYMSFEAIQSIEPSLKKGPLSKQDHNNEQPAFHFLFCETLIAYDHTKKELMIIIHVPTKQSTFLKEQYDAAFSQIDELFTTLERSTSGLMVPAAIENTEEVSFDGVLSSYTKPDFMKDVETIQEYIRAGDIFQAVLSQRFEMPVTSSAFDIYRVLRMVNPSPYLFYLKIGDVEVVGSSPERLVQVADKHVEIHPIAGTRPRGADEELDNQLAKELLADEKERAEHYMLVDLARNDVGRVAEYGSVKTPTLLEIGRFSHVMHIISKVTGELREGITPLNALMSAFPAGTVSGAPKIRAIEILNELEPVKRGIYSGAIGYLSYDGNIDSCIAIRTMIIKDQKAYIQAGAGVVADSIPEKEFEETQNKAKALLRAVQLAEKMFGEGAVVNHV